jgi:hypothetical protein
MSFFIFAETQENFNINLLELSGLLEELKIYLSSDLSKSFPLVFRFDYQNGTKTININKIRTRTLKIC